MDVGVSMTVYLLALACGVGGGSGCLSCQVAVVSRTSADRILACLWLSILEGLLFGMPDYRFAHTMIFLLLCMNWGDVRRRLISGLLACVILASTW